MVVGSNPEADDFKHLRNSFLQKEVSSVPTVPGDVAAQARAAGLAAGEVVKERNGSRDEAARAAEAAARAAGGGRDVCAEVAGEAAGEVALAETHDRRAAAAAAAAAARDAGGSLNGGGAQAGAGTRPRAAGGLFRPRCKPRGPLTGRAKYR